MMKKNLTQMVSISSFLIISILLVCAVPVHAEGQPIVRGVAGEALTDVEQDSIFPNKAGKHYFVADSAFHVFFQRGKHHLSLLGQRFKFVFSSYRDVPSELIKALDRLAGGKGGGHLITILLLFSLPLALGFGAERFANLYLQKLKRNLQSTIPQSFWQLFARISARMLIELVSFAVFVLIVVALFLLFYSVQSPMYELAVIFLPPIFMIRISYILLNFLYSPAAPHMRIVPQNCPSSKMYLRGFMTLIIATVFATKILMLLKTYGLSEGVYLLFYSHLGLFQFTILLVMLWKDRKRITHLIGKKQSEKEPQSSSFADKILSLWFPLAFTALLGFELLWQANLLIYQKDLVLPLLLTVLSIPFGLLLFSIGNRLLHIAAGQTGLLDPRIVNQDILPKDADISAFVDVVLPPQPILDVRAAGSSAQKTSLIMRHLKLIRTLMGVLIAFALVFWVMDLWGLNLPLGRAVIRSALSIFATLLLAYVFWEICRGFIDRKLEEDRPLSDQDDDMEEGSEGSRRGTLLTLLRKVIISLLAVTVILITLNAVGINIGPLLAGAGILGIAIGFGSQTLVRDILSGVFYLIDDAFRVGDYIETGGTKGMVEHISLRSVKLRHPRGMVYTIPYGDMGSVQNYSRDYIITKLDVRVRYDADVEKIRKIVKKINKDLTKDSEIGQVLLSKIKSQGVREMDDSAMILRIKFKTKPGEQFVVRREVYRRIQESFRQHGIEFAHRNVTVYLPPEVTGEASTDDRGDGAADGPRNRKLIGAGAAAALAEHEKKAAKGKG
ncbi:MAG: mechanosensitive ion channel family protein [Desulfobacterales bacterium]|nr:MAG: mechanosensitive ion channel family protein [Desulfobacterales bacterium]